MRTAGTDDGGGAVLPSYMTSRPTAPMPGLLSYLSSQSGDHGYAPSITTGGDPTANMYGDPSYQALLAALHGNEDAFSSQMRSQIQRAALNAGYDVPELSPYLDAGMLDQIKNNPNSLAAMSKQGHANNMRALQNALAARGGYNSGELTYGVGNEDQRFNQEGLSQRGSLLDSINSLLGQQAQMKGDNAAQLAGELGNAAARQAELHPTSTANWDASTGSYVDSYGNHFNHDGSPYTAPKPAAPAAPKPPTVHSFTPLPNQGTGPYIGTKTLMPHYSAGL